MGSPRAEASFDIFIVLVLAGEMKYASPKIGKKGVPKFIFPEFRESVAVHATPISDI